MVLLLVFVPLFQPPFTFRHLHSFLSILDTYLSVSSFLSRPSFPLFLLLPPHLPLFQSLSSLMAPHVNLSGLVYFAASCYSSSEVTPHRGIRTLPFTSIPSSPYLLTFICRRTHPQPVESCHVGAKN